MIKLSRTGITTLKRQYKSVLLKCLLINAGILLAAGSANATVDVLTGVDSTPYNNVAITNGSEIVISQITVNGVNGTQTQTATVYTSGEVDTALAGKTTLADVINDATNIATGHLGAAVSSVSATTAGNAITTALASGGAIRNYVEGQNYTTLAEVINDATNTDSAHLGGKVIAAVVDDATNTGTGHLGAAINTAATTAAGDAITTALGDGGAIKTAISTAASAAETNAKAYADSLASNYDAAGAAAAVDAKLGGSFSSTNTVAAAINAKQDAFSVAANSGLTLDGGYLWVNSDNTTIGLNATSNKLEVKDSGITSAKIADGTVAKVDLATAVQNNLLDNATTGNGLVITDGTSETAANISLKLNETASGLVADANGLAVKLNGTNSGLAAGADGLSVNIKDKGGLTSTADGLAVVTGNTTKLSDTGALEVKDLQVSDFKSGVIVEEIGDTASNTQLATALATKNAIETGAEKADYTNTVAATATHISHNTLQGAIADLDTTIGDMSEFDQNHYAKSETSVAANFTSLDTALYNVDSIVGGKETGPIATPTLVAGKIGDEVTVVAALRSVADNAAGLHMDNTFDGNNVFKGTTTFNNSNGITIGNMADSSDAAYKSASITTTSEGALNLGANTEVNGSLKVGAANAITGVAAAGEEPAKLDMGKNGLTNVNGLTLTDGETTPTTATISVSKVASVGAVVDIDADVVTSTEFRASSALTVEDASHNEVFVADASGITVGDGTNDYFTVDATSGNVTAAGIGHFGDTTDYVEMNAGDLEVTGDASIGGALDVDGDLKVGEKFKVTAETGKISAAGGTFLVKEGGLVSAAGGTFLVKENGQVSAAAGKFVVTEGGRVSAAGGNFIIETDGSFGLNNGKFNVDKDGNTTVKGTLGVDGATTLNDTLTVAKATTLNDTLTVAKAATLNDTLTVAGATTLNDTLTVAKAATFNDTVTVAGATTLNDTLTVAKATTLNDTLTVAGDTRIGEKFKVTAENGTLSAAAGTFLVKEGGLVSAAGGTFLVKENGLVSAAGGTFLVKENGQVSAAAGKFVVTEGGRLSAAGGNFIIETDGSFGLNNGKFNVDKDGNTTIAGLTTLSADNGMRFGDGQVVKSIDDGTVARTVAAGNEEALATVATVLTSAENAVYTGTALDTTGATPATIKDGLNLIGDTSSFANGRYVSNARDLSGAVMDLDRGLSDLAHEVRDFKKEFKSGMAQMAAMSALVPNARSNGNTQISVGTGAYSGQTAAAFGAFHWVNDNLLLNAGVSYGNSNNVAYRAGLTWSW